MKRGASTALIPAAGAVAAAFGLLALLGWGLDLAPLASLASGRIPMAPSTALLFLAFGSGLLLGPSRAGRALVAAAAAAASSLLLASLFRLSLDFESLGLSLSRAAQGAPIGHMSPVTAICFALSGASFLLSPPSDAQPRERPRWRGAIALASACLVLASCLAFLLGYLFGTPLLYRSALIPPALPTILSFAAIGTALTLSAYDGTFRLPGPGEEGRRLRRFFAPGMILFAVASIVAGYLYFLGYEGKAYGEVERMLDSVSALKSGELVRFRGERLGDAALLSGNATYSRLVRNFLAGAGGGGAASELEAWLGAYIAHKQYDAAYLIDAAGVARLSLPRRGAPLARALARGAAACLLSGQAGFEDFYLDEGDGRIRLAVLAPIRDEAAGGRPLGAVALRIDPAAYLYPFIQSWPTPSRSAETLLIRREGDSALFLNDLRFMRGAALRLIVPLANVDMPAVKAALGLEGIVEGEDYRGVAVIASVRSVPGSPWFLVAQVDASEATGPIRARMWLVLSLVAALVLAEAVVFLSFLRSLRLRFYREKYATVQALRETSAYLESLLDYANAPIIVWDPEFRVTRFNRAFEALTGLEARSVLGGPLDPLFPPEQAEASLRLIKETSPGRRWQTVEMDIQSAEKGVRAVLWNSAPIYAADGRTLIATIAQGQDITAVKEAEGRLTEQVEELRRWQEVMLGRESRIMELKWEVNELLSRAGLELRYREGGDA